MKTKAACPGNQARLLAASVAWWRKFVDDQLYVGHWGAGKEMDPQDSDLVPRSSPPSYCYYRSQMGAKKNSIFLKSHFNGHVSVYGRQTRVRQEQDRERGVTREGLREKCADEKEQEDVLPPLRVARDTAAVLQLLTLGEACYFFFLGLGFPLCKHRRLSVPSRCKIFQFYDVGLWLNWPLCGRPGWWLKVLDPECISSHSAYHFLPVWPWTAVGLRHLHTENTDWQRATLSTSEPYCPWPILRDSRRLGELTFSLCYLISSLFSNMGQKSTESNHSIYIFK